MGMETFEGMCASAGKEHVEFRDRIHKSLYYGQYSDKSLPSLAVTDVAVEVLSSVTPTKEKSLGTSYAMAISRRARISPCTLIMGVLYSERLHLKNPDALGRVTSSDLFLISMMLASKYLYDEGEDEERFNDEWARAGSKTVDEVNKLEMEFLASIDWSLFVSNEDFMDFVNRIESRVATTQGLRRGWFTYADLCTLLDNSKFLEMLTSFRLEVVKVLCACTVAYVLSISLALSITMLANHSFHERFFNEHVTTCATDDQISRLNRLAVTTKISSHLEQSHGTNMTGFTIQEVNNKSLMEAVVTTGSNKSVHKTSLLQPITSCCSLGKSKANFQSSCSLQSTLNSLNFPVIKDEKVVERNEILMCKCTTPGFQSCLQCEITLQEHCPLQRTTSVSFLDSHRKFLDQSDFIFSNFSQGVETATIA